MDQRIPPPPAQHILLQSHADMAGNHRLGQEGDSSSNWGPYAADGFLEPMLIFLNRPEIYLGLPIKK